MATGTFNEGLDTARDEVRSLIGDIKAPFLLADRAIDGFLTRNSNNVLRTAIEAAYHIVSMYSSSTSVSVGPFSISGADLAANYEKLIDRLRSMSSAIGAPRPFASGWSKSAKQAEEADTDREATFAGKGIHDNPNIDPQEAFWWVNGWV